MKTLLTLLAVLIIGGIAYTIFMPSENEDMMDDDDSSMMDDNNMNDANEDMSEEGVLVGGAAMLPSRDIVDNAVLADNVTTLVTAVQVAELVDTLKSAGPFTVFAPTNSAFAALPDGTVDTLLMPENQADLQAVLTYHVVPGIYTAADLIDGLTLTTVQGTELLFSTSASGMLLINGSAMIETADVISSNGVTHVIDTVLLPPSDA